MGRRSFRWEARDLRGQAPVILQFLRKAPSLSHTDLGLKLSSLRHVCRQPLPIHIQLSTTGDCRKLKGLQNVTLPTIGHSACRIPTHHTLVSSLPQSHGSASLVPTVAE